MFQVFNVVASYGTEVLESEQELVPESFALEPLTLEPLSAHWPKMTTSAPPLWGVDHPQFSKENPKRVPWTAEETAYIGAWIDSQPAEVSRERLATRCLAAIRKDPSAQRIFHQHHVLGSERLRNGIDAYYRSVKY